MAQMPPNYPNIVKRVDSELSWKCRGTIQHNVVLINITRNRASPNFRRRVISGGRIVLHCRSSSSSSSSPSSSVEELKLAIDGKSEDDQNKSKFGYVVNEYGWNIRRMVEAEAEMKEVANIQAEAFHEPVFFFNQLFFKFFQAEVLAGLVYKLKNSSPDRYTCLVAEAILPDNPGVKKEPVGVVDLTVYRDYDVMKHLPGADEYLYVSGIAVLNKFRRQKVATALLKGCDMIARLWGFEYLVLRAYEDDLGAQKLYTNAGYKVVSGDLPWITWIGRRPRVIMIKKFHHIK